MKISRLDGVDSWDNTDNSVTSQRNDTRHKSIGLGELSSKFDEFLAGRSQFDRDHGVDFYAPTSCQSATFVRPLFAF